MDLLEVTKRYVYNENEINKKDKLLNEANRKIAEEYEAGALKWIELNRPELDRKIKETINRVDKALLKDKDEFISALETYVKIHLEAIKTFKKNNIEKNYVK